MSGDPIVFPEVARAVLTWVASPTVVLLLALSWFVYTLARIVSHATAGRKDGRR